MQTTTTLHPGPAVPTRGNGFSRWLGRLAFNGLGWRFEGSIPNLPKAVVIVAPHTSNWDFVIGVAAMFAVGIRVVFLGKHTLFRPPLGRLMRWLGGLPVDRRAASGVVDEAIGMFAQHDSMILALSPEGTRRRVARWKTGFYYVAVGADVPIVPVAFNYSTRVIRFGAPLRPSGDLETDLRRLSEFFAHATGFKMT
ncbi:MAG: lysophospholipid acyltransferase family protein [Holophagae bacterium]|jgi:1-acyl-sn-glycerol-3-phosphate acyltransferase